jgi:hypothetical protein
VAVCVRRLDAADLSYLLLPSTQVVLGSLENDVRGAGTGAILFFIHCA